jgi:shikimate dehydrogenase
LIYKNTTLLQKASKKGCKTLNGLGMLLWQGAFAFELWTGKKPPVEVMRKALLANL